MNKQLIEIIDNFRTFLNKEFELIIENTFSNSEIDYQNLFLFLIRKACTGESYNVLLCEDKLDGNYDFNLSTYRKAREKISSDAMEKINGDLIDFMYNFINLYKENMKSEGKNDLKNQKNYESVTEPKNMKNTNREITKEKGRLLAVDGTYISFDKTKNTYFLTPSPGGEYVIGLVSGIYDINNSIPINYKLFEIKDERSALKSQLKYLKKGDTLVMDRGYFSDELVVTLKKQGYDTICRMKGNSKYVKDY